MALTNNIELVQMLRGFEVSIPADAEDMFYKGALTNVNATGELVVAGDVATQKFAGFVTEMVSAVAGTMVKVRKSEIIVVNFATAAIADIGDDFFATADDTVAKSATNVPRMGVCVDVEVGVSVTIDTAYAENA